MRGLVLIGLLGGGAFLAYRAGYLPQLAPVADAVDDFAGPWLGRVANILPVEMWTEPQDARDREADALREASGGRVVPILGSGEVVTVNKYEGALRANWVEVSPWARQNLAWAAAILKVENGPLDPSLSGDNGTSHGVGQVKVATAETCYRAGYTRHEPTVETLKTMAGGIYFATAEMDRLARMGKGLDWTIAAYNGGAGWEAMGSAYKAARLEYVAKVKRAFAALYGGAMA